MEASLISINFQQMLRFISFSGTRNHLKRRESICRLNEFESDKEKISVYQMSDDREVGFQPTEKKKVQSQILLVLVDFVNPVILVTKKFKGFFC